MYPCPHLSALVTVSLFFMCGSLFLFGATCMDLEIIVLSEISQTQTSITWDCWYEQPKKYGTIELIYKTELSKIQIQSCNSPIQWFPSAFICFFNIYLFMWLCQALVATHRIFSCGMWDLVLWPGFEPGPLECYTLDYRGKFPTLPLI